MMRTSAMVITVWACVLVSGCAGSHGSNGLAAKIDEHAVTAGNVMTQVRGPLPARAVALQVTGQTPYTTIQALTATGSTRGGVVTLKIEVIDEEPSFGTADHATQCFDYRFSYPRNADYRTPHPSSCGQRPPLDLTSPPLPVGIDAGTRTAVQRALGTLSPHQRGQSEAVKATLARALGPDYTIEGGPEDSGVFTWVRYGDQCLTAQTSPTTEQRVSQPRHGPNCYGG